jgi:hypothetical protein
MCDWAIELLDGLDVSIDGEETTRGFKQAVLWKVGIFCQWLRKSEISQAVR